MTPLSRLRERITTPAPRQLTAAMSAPATGFLGLAVLVVMLQSSGGFAVEMLGPDLLLAVSGFVVTQSLLNGADRAGRIAPLTWYREQLTLNLPLLMILPLAVLTVTAFSGPYVQGGQTAADVLSGLVPTGIWWELLAGSERTDRIDPLGPLWLIGLLAQFSLLWPALLAGLHRLLQAELGSRMLSLLAPTVVTLALGAWLVGPVRGQSGADLAELTLGSHVRAAEWLVGAAAAATVAGLRDCRTGFSRAQTPVLAAFGGGLLLTMAVLATTEPAAWLRLGGPATAAFGAAIVLLAAHLPEDGPIGRAFGHGLPAELGRMAYPLLLLHSLIFWVLQLAVPTARPVALLAVGGALAWLVGLVLHDGVIRRLRARYRTLRTTAPAVLTAGVAVVLLTVVVGDRVANAAQGRTAPSAVPIVLVLGGSHAGELAGALDLPGSGYHVVDGSRRGCGLLAAPNQRQVRNKARTTALAQVPASAPECGDWSQWWGSRIGAVRPDAVVVDLSDDLAPRSGVDAPPPICSPAFRAQYRELIAAAVRVAGTDDPARPMLLTTGLDAGVTATAGADNGSRRCFTALLSEAATGYRSVLPLTLEGGLDAQRPTLRESVTAALRKDP